jgi:hypothetical protein
MAVDSGSQPTFGQGAVARLIRGLLAAATVAALVTAYVSINFFFYFTVLSNILSAMLMTGQALRPRWMSTNGSLRGAVTLYMSITGLVYAVLLRPIEADVGLSDQWVNWVLHSLGPAALLIDWLLFPPRMRLARNALWLWLLYPAIYLAVTLIRGPMVDWYPYPFLDPRGEGGFPSVAAYSVGVLILFLGVGWFVRWWADAKATERNVSVETEEV